MAYRLDYKVRVSWVPPGEGLGQNNLAGPGMLGGPAQSIDFFGTQGSSTPVSSTFTASDVTTLLTALATDVAAQMNVAATLARIQGFSSGGG